MSQSSGSPPKPLLTLHSSETEDGGGSSNDRIALQDQDQDEDQDHHQSPKPRGVSSSSSLLLERDHHQLDHHKIIIRPPPPPQPLMFKYKYMECQKNHAAAIGGKATDGCGEFMPGGEEGSLEALKCSACNCHRNFHRKLQIHPSSTSSDEPPPSAAFIPPPPPPHMMMMMRKSSTGNTSTTVYGVGGGGGSADDIELGLAIGRRHRNDNEGGEVVMMKKRFRTKFSSEQKEKMHEFAERAGWKIQKLDDSEVRRFCHEIGIKRKVLKVWMHNNKYHFSKKNTSTTNTTSNTQSAEIE